MSFNFKLKQLAVLVGDVFLFYATLILALIVRYGYSDLTYYFRAHLKPFSLILVVWLSIFYLADLYQVKILKNDITLIGNLSLAVVIAAIVSIIIFYLLSPVLGLTPKTNLLIFGFVFGSSSYVWRLLVANALLFNGWRYRLLMIGNSPRIAEIVSYLNSNLPLGYDVVSWLKENKKLTSKIFGN